MGKPKPRIKKRKSRRKLAARPYRNYSAEMLEIAVELVANNKVSSREAEKQFGIPRRTILNKVAKRHMNAVGAPTRLTNEEEQNLLRVIIAAGDFGTPLTRLDVRILVFNYLKKNGREDIFNNKLPGEMWIRNFLSRHAESLTIRATQNISSARAKKGEDEMIDYFTNLKETLKDVPPSNVMNYDETNCSDNPGSTKAIFRRGVKYPERIINSTKGCISIMFSGTGDGKFLPPYIVYRAEHLYDAWVLGGPDGARYNCTKSGWFDSAIFEDFFRTVVVEWAKKLVGPKVVIGDNLSSHLNPEVVKLCEKHDIRFVFLPPNSTHITQPLDVAFFGPLKREWRKILFEYKIQNPVQNKLNKKHFPNLLTKLIENTHIRQGNNIKSGFKATGICPLDPRQVLKKIPEYDADPSKYGIDESLLEYLKQTRAPNPMVNKRSKKINTEPGKSVSTADINILFEKKRGKTCQPETRKKRNTREAIKEFNLDMDFDMDDNINDAINTETEPIVENYLHENTGELIINNKMKEIQHHNKHENIIDSIEEYVEEIHDKKMNNATGKQHRNEMEENTDIITEEVLDEMTGIIKTFVITKVCLHDNKHHSQAKDIVIRQNNRIYSKVCESDKENISQNIQTNNEKSGKIKILSNVRINPVVPKKQEIMEECENMHVQCTEDQKYTEDLEVEFLDPFDMTVQENQENTNKVENMEEQETTSKIMEYLIKNKNIKKKTEDSETDISGDFSLKDSSDAEDFEFEEEEDEEHEEEEKKTSSGSSSICNALNVISLTDLQKDQFILVKFEVHKSFRHYIGKIIDIDGVSLTVKFMRKKQNNLFYWPQVEDTSVIFVQDVVKILTYNECRRGLIRMNENIECFNLT